MVTGNGLYQHTAENPASADNCNIHFYLSFTRFFRQPPG